MPINVRLDQKTPVVQSTPVNSAYGTPHTPRAPLPYPRTYFEDHLRILSRFPAFQSANLYCSSCFEFMDGYIHTCSRYMMVGYIHHIALACTCTKRMMVDGSRQRLQTEKWGLGRSLTSFASQMCTSLCLGVLFPPLPSHPPPFRFVTVVSSILPFIRPSYLSACSPALLFC